MAATQSPYFISQPEYSTNTTSQPDQSFNFNTRVSPSILLIIVILAVIFFVSGLLHLLVRFLLRPSGPTSRRRSAADDDDTESVSALQGQLQQLFHLHDAGVDQSFIDSLPVFQYTAIITGAAAKRPFDCAVCLCEFEPLDKLRLLPKCSHAFHTDCIDTWLLSHSTCPLCRASLLFSSAAVPNADNFSPIVLVLESADSSSNTASAEISNTTQEFTRNNEEPPTSLRDFIVSEGRESIVTVKLGKFASLENNGGGEASSSSASVGLSASNSVDSRRCFSMGSFAYVMDESSNLRVPIRMPSVKKSGPKNPNKNALSGPARVAMSECGCESGREFEFIGEATPAAKRVANSAEISKKESFSISKIWLRSKKEKETNTSGNSCSVECSRRAFSFRFQRSFNKDNNNGVNGGALGEDLKGKSGKFPRRTVSEIGVARWESEGIGNMGFEEEIQSCNSLDSQSNPPSFARKTLLWLMGRQQNKVVHSSFDHNNIP